MIIETKNLSPSETMLFFPVPLPLQGAFYESSCASDCLPLLQNIAAAGNVEELLLTADFIYLKGKDAAALENLEALAFAELDDCSLQPESLTAPASHTAAKSRIIIKTIIAPFLQKDGGDIELLSYNNKTATVRFLGKCHGCPYAQRTLKERVEKNLIRYLPEIREVVLA